MADTTSSTQRAGTNPNAVALAVFCGACALDSISDPPCPICGNTGLDLRAVQRAIDALITERDDAGTAARLNAETISGMQAALAGYRNRNAELNRALRKASDALDDCEDYFEPKADAEDGPIGPTGNTEMNRLVEVREALAAIKGCQR